MASVAISLAIAGGGMALQYLFAPRAGKQQPVEKGKLDDVRITSSDYGAFITRLRGRARIGGNIIWSNGVEEFIVNTPSGGGKGVPQAPATRTYTYKSSFAVLVCRGQIANYYRIWADANLLTNNSAENRADLEAENATLSGGASVVNPDATASGGKSVTNLGNGGKAVFDLSLITNPTEPPPGDPNEEAVAYTSVSFYYKCATALTAKITGGAWTSQTVSFPATGSDWTTKTVQIPNFVSSLTFENPSAAAPNLDLISAEKYYHIDIIPAFKNPGYTVTGFANPDIVYPLDLDDPSAYYNYQPTADAKGLESVTTAIPGEQIRFYKGSSDQLQDSAIVSYLDSKYGSGQGTLRTPAFRDLAYIMFENRTLKQARVENFTFEIDAGSPSVNDVLTGLFGDVGITSGYYDVSATAGLTQIGFLEHTSRSRRSLIEDLERYHQFRIVEIDGKIKTILDSDASLATLSVDSLRAADNSEITDFDAEILVKDRATMPRAVRCSIMNPAIEYHNETVEARLQITAASNETREYNFPIIDTPANARLTAEKLLLKEHAEDKAIELSSMPGIMRYAPGDVVTFPINGISHKVRIEKMVMSLPIGAVQVQGVALARFNAVYYQSDVTSLSPKLTTQFATYNHPRNSVVIPINSLPLNDADRNKMGLYLAVCGRGRGVSKNFALYRELDADNYVLQSIVDVPSVAGLCAGTLATVGDTTVEDTTNTLDIWFFDDIELETVTQPDLDKLPTLNLMRVGDEWVQFRTATAQTLEENSPYRSKWRISNLWRARFGTSGKESTHAADEYAVLYNRAVGFYELNSDDIGEDISFKAVTNGQDVEVASITTIASFTPLSSYTITNDTATRTLDADATDLDEVADVLSTVIKDLNL